VELSIPGVKTYAVLPKRVPDLFRGSQVLVVGRYRTDGDSLVRLTGHFDNQSVNHDFEGTFPASSKDNAFIARLWAQRQVGYLLDEIRLNGEKAELRDEVVQLATKYGIVTPYTSYLVVEESSQAVAAPRREAQRPAPVGGRTGMGTSFGMGGGAKAAEEPAPASTPGDGLLADEALSQSTGSTAVASAKALRKMKETSRADQDKRSAVRQAGGRTFEWRDGHWVDRALANQKKIQVKYLSAAYFDLLQAIPELADYAALGERVTVVRGKMALVIDSSGRETLSRQEIDALK
jgi:Ca-activated chloride channel family protein